MNLRHIALMVGVLAVFTASGRVPAFADQPAGPPLTRDFVKYCDANPANCSDLIFMVDIARMMRTLGREEACIPDAARESADGPLTKESLGKVKAWVAAHPALADRPTAETLETAIKEVWPWTKACAEEAGDDLPKVTGPFLAYCAHEDKAHKSNCMDVIADVGFALLLKEPGKYCDPDWSTSTTEAYIRYINSIKAWLRTHRELANEPRNASIATAYRTLYPCGK